MDSSRNLSARLTRLRKRLNWSPADLARSLGVTQAEVEGWEAGFWRPQEENLSLLESLEKGSARYYSAVDDGSEEGCPTWQPLQAESLAEARAEAEEALKAAGDRIILAENRTLNARGKAAEAGLRVAAVWSAGRGWLMSD